MGSSPASPDTWHGTTILTVRKGGKVVIAGDGQVTLGQTIIKGTARKVRRVGTGNVIAGFAGSTADAFTLFERLESKLERFPDQFKRACVELAKDWRTDRYLRRLEAMMIVADADESLVLDRHRRRARARRRGDGHRLRRRPMRSPPRVRCSTRTSMPRRLRAGPWPLPPRFASTPMTRWSSKPLDAANVDRKSMTSFSPREIVSELDRHIVGQRDAKRAVAIALRNRWRRQQLDEEMREEVLPKNILMIGPTGVGKTEISRRLAKLAGAPFIKVEATKFTEVGYVGRDVDQIVRDLLEAGIGLVRDVKRKEVAAKAQLNAEERVIDALVGSGAAVSTREAFRKRLRTGELDDKEIEIQVADMPSMPSFEIPGMPGSQVGMINLSEVLGKALGNRTKPRKVTVRDSFDILLGEESDKLIDNDLIVQEAIRNVENNGIVFLDEIDKICARSERIGADVSREGVQRDLLPLIEGTTVGTKYGPVKTDHILFIASGAFHIAKPSDLLPELQGRLPIRVELRALTRDDFRRILTEPKACLIKQYVALMKTEGVELEFTPDSIEAIADVAVEVNTAVENIGARRLMTVMERILDNISFDAGDRAGEKVVIDAAYVEKHIGDLAKNADLSKFIL